MVPLGAHAGVKLRGLDVTFWTFDPSRLATYTSGAPSRSLAKASLVPSGDQAGSPSDAGPVGSGSRRSPCPSACMTQIDRLPSARLSNAIRFPSGDHAGRASKARGRLVSVWGALPSRLTTNTDAGTIF